MSPASTSSTHPKKLFDLGLITQQWHAISGEHREGNLWVSHSGGADSTALVHAISHWIKSTPTLDPPPSWGICHINYHLRDEASDLDADFSHKLARSMGVPFRLFSSGPAPKTGVQAWARNVRRQFWRELVQNGGVVALGHHLDDVAENVLFRMARGTSLGCLAGMTTWSPPLWRPLLAYTKTDLMHWLEGWSAVYRSDASNEISKYSRNRIRIDILPVLEGMFPGASRRIAALAFDAQELHLKIENQENLEAIDATLSFASKLKQKYRALGCSSPQLSRRWLETIITPNKSPSPLPSKPVQVPGGRAVVVQQDSSMTLLSPHEMFMKPLQRQQMQRSLTPPMISCFLPSDGTVLILRDPQKLDDHQRKFLQIHNNDTVPHGISIEPLSSALTFSSNHLKMRVKDLLRRWKIPHPLRCRWRIIKYDGNVSCLSNGLVYWDGASPTFNLKIPTPIPPGPGELSDVSNDKIEGNHVVGGRANRQSCYQVINVLVPNSR